MSRKRKFAALAVAGLWIVWAAAVAFLPELRAFWNSETRVETRPPAVCARADGIVRICSWNVCNYNVSRRRCGNEWRESPKPEVEKAALRKALMEMDADIVIIGEMGDAQFLEELRLDLKREGLYYPYVFVTRHDSPSRLAMLSKLKPEAVFDFSDTSFDFCEERRFSPRGALGAEFKSGDVRWFAFGVHLKSKQGAKKTDEAFTPFRFAEIRALDSRISDVSRGAAVIIGGDFNDECSETVLRNFKNLNMSPLPQFDSSGESWTYFWEKKSIRYVYDFFLVNAAMRRFADKPVGIADSDGASDHRPIFVDLKF